MEKISSRTELTNHLVHLFKNTPLPILDKLIYLIQGKVGQIIKGQRWAKYVISKQYQKLLIGLTLITNLKLVKISLHLLRIVTSVMPAKLEMST